MLEMQSVIWKIAGSLRSVGELEAALAPRGVRALELLRVHRVPVVDGYFSAPALQAAMGLVRPKEARLSSERAPVDVLGAALEVGGVQITTAKKRRGWHLQLSTVGEARQVSNPVLQRVWQGTPLRSVVVGSDGIGARLYFIQKRHSGAANFVVSGAESLDPPALHFFILLDEPKVWVASSELLARLAADARREPNVHRLERVRVAPSAEVGGQLRCWFPQGDSPLDLEVQLRNPQGELVTPTVVSHAPPPPAHHSLS